MGWNWYFVEVAQRLGYKRFDKKVRKYLTAIYGQKKFKVNEKDAKAFTGTGKHASKSLLK